jgi:hypothetical protein
MTRNRFTQIGLDRLVRLAWLEKTSSLVLAGNDTKSIKSFLQSDLQGAFYSDNIHTRGSIDKTITILMRVWLTVPKELESLRSEGLDFLKCVPLYDHLVVHWGMLMAVYPFWSSVAMQVGRLLKLQGSVSAIHVQRRVREQYGERETVSRRTRYALRSYMDWGVLQDTGSKGIYKTGKILSVENLRLIVWLIEAVLHSRAIGSVLLNDLIESPNLFPFSIRPVKAENLVALSSRLDFIRQGFNDDLIFLKPE